jgi:hypothetical protein
MHHRIEIDNILIGLLANGIAIRGVLFHHHRSFVSVCDLLRKMTDSLH